MGEILAADAWAWGTAYISGVFVFAVIAVALGCRGRDRKGVPWPLAILWPIVGLIMLVGGVGAVIHGGAEVVVLFLGGQLRRLGLGLRRVLVRGDGEKT